MTVRSTSVMITAANCGGCSTKGSDRRVQPADDRRGNTVGGQLSGLGSYGLVLNEGPSAGGSSAAVGTGVHHQSSSNLRPASRRSSFASAAAKNENSRGALSAKHLKICSTFSLLRDGEAPHAR